MTIQANQGFGVSIFGATSAGGGGSTSPGGSSGQLQYNASGSFGGMAGTSWDDTNRALTLTGATVTTSQPVLNLSQTWNAGAVTFTGLKFNATDTASASGSLLLDLQVGGTSRFSIRKDGYYTFGGTGTNASPCVVDVTGPSQAIISANRNLTLTAGGGWNVTATNNFVVNNSTIALSFSGVSEVIFSRGAGSAASTPQFQLGAADAAAPVAQTLQVQSVVAGGAGASDVAGANWTLKGSAGRGSGAGGSIIFQVAPAGSAGTGAQNAYTNALSLDGNAGLATFSGSIGNTGDTYLCSHTGALEARGFRVRSTASFSFSSGAASGTSDVFLLRDAANTLALRNGANAQTYRIYATADGSPGSNFQRLVLSAGATANMAVVAADNGGTGVAMGLQFGAALTTGGGVTNIMNINTSGHLVWNTDNTYDIGASGASRPRNIYAGSSVFGSGLYATSIIQVTASAGRLDIGGDASLYRDAANTLANRNGTSAQKFRVYNTYTSSTNYENFEIDWQTTANTALVGPTKGSGGGTQRVQRLQYLEDGGTGSTTPSLGTTCPAASATIKSWIKVVTSDGTTAYIPCWA